MQTSGYGECNSKVINETGLLEKMNILRYEDEMGIWNRISAAVSKVITPELLMALNGRTVSRQTMEVILLSGRIKSKRTECAYDLSCSEKFTFEIMSLEVNGMEGLISMGVITKQGESGR